MDQFENNIGLDCPARYEIKVQGCLDWDLSDWLVNVLVQDYRPGDGQQGITTIVGVIADQPALHGLLNYIRDLGIPLLFVDCLDAHEKTG